ncbi:MAG: methyltransferase [Holosporaceae bacterium]|jgi:tRNA1(Val) A37 N6-methylase TrmN6|nr:methyltransferase [Holosporaceae bacterium]
MEYTQDSILNGNIIIRQPTKGYRVAIDPIILASLVHQEPWQTILDVGCGVGTVSLILKWREPTVQVTALDIDSEMCTACCQNARINSLEINVINASIEECLSAVCGEFSQVVTNPPFFEKKSSRVSEFKKMANFETVPLTDWIALCLKKVKNNGIFTIIHRASRLNDILYALKNSPFIMGDIKIVPIFPKIGLAANRIVVIAKKSCKSETKIFQGIVVHNMDGSYTISMEKILGGYEWPTQG